MEVKKKIVIVLLSCWKCQSAFDFMLQEDFTQQTMHLTLYMTNFGCFRKRHLYLKKQKKQYLK